MNEFLAVPVSLLPVLIFLGLLILLDSYKLVPLAQVLWSVAAGCVAAGVAAAVNPVAMGLLDLELTRYSRYVAPVLEEMVKAVWVGYLIHRGRAGFLVDAAIHGFAIGAGFALVENGYYLYSLGDASIFLWIVRGFGTAIMHGSATAILAILAKGLADRHATEAPWVFLPGLAVAVILHSLFNHFLLPPLAVTLLQLIVLPPLLAGTFARSERATRSWLGVGFDTEAELLELIHSGEIADTRVGRYLETLKERFPGEVVADLLCYLQVYLELATRAKGIMMAREAGLDVKPDADVRANLTELRNLERSVGRTGLLAILPFLTRSRRDLWQIYMLDRPAGRGGDPRP